jgi:hypothetical protein
MAPGSTHSFRVNGKLAMATPQLTHDLTPTKLKSGAVSLTFGIGYNVANDRSSSHIKADEAIIHLSVASTLLPNGPSTLSPVYSHTIVDTQLTQPSLAKTYTLTVPASAVRFLESHGLDSNDPATRQAALRAVSIDVEQLRDFHHVDGSYDWQEGGFWTGADHSIHTTTGTENSTVTVANNTNSGVYNVNTSGMVPVVNNANSPTHSNPTASLVQSTSQFGTPISLAGQAVECVNQGAGSNPAGFSLLNGWDIQDNLPPGVLPPGATVTEPVIANDSLGNETEAAAQNASAAVIDTGLSAMGLVTPGFESAASTLLAVFGAAGSAFDIASGVPIGAILGLIKVILAEKQSCADQPSLINLTAAEPAGGQSSISWLDQNEGFAQDYLGLYGSSVPANEPPITDSVALAASTGTITVPGQAPVHPYLAQVPSLPCGAANGNSHDVCGDVSVGNNFVNVDWAINNPCPSGFSCTEAPPTSPQISIAGTDLCGANNALCPIIPQPATNTTINAPEALAAQSPPAYAVIGHVFPNTQINALTTLNGVAYAGGQNGNIYQFTPAVTTVNASSTTNTTSNFSTVASNLGSPVDCMATVGTTIWFGVENGGLYSYQPGQSPQIYSAGSSAAYPKYMAVAGGQLYVTLSNSAVVSPYTSPPPAGAPPFITVSQTYPGLASGATINAMTTGAGSLFVGFTGGQVYGCSFAAGQCNTSYAMVGINVSPVLPGGNVDALGVIANTLWVGMSSGALLAEPTSGASLTSFYNGSPGNNPSKSNANPDAISGMAIVGGNVYYGGCLGIVDPTTTDMIGVATYSGQNPFATNPGYNGCTNPTDTGSTEYQGFQAATNNYALVASNTAPTPGQPAVVYVAGHIGSGNYLWALENLLPTTSATCLSNQNGC